MTALHLRLSVNVDHVATIRQARQVAYPDPVEAAAIAEAAGADGITVHLRQDRRHIQEGDVSTLRRSIAGRLNLEMAATEEMVAIALDTGPHKVTLVPERDDEVTTEGGLDLVRQRRRVEEVARRLDDAGIEVALFVDPETEQIAVLEELREAVPGYEINTDAYTRDATPEQVEKVQRAVIRGTELGLHVFAGHGLTCENVGPIAAMPAIEELNIGHALVARAVLVGMRAAVQEMRQAMDRAREAG